MRLTLELEIYTYQIDFSNHVSNIVYIQWMEIARLKLLQTAGMEVSRIAKAGFVPILAETHIVYRKPLYLGDRVTVEVWISELGRASAVTSFRFLNGDGEEAAHGKQKGLFIRLDTNRPYRISDEERAPFLPYLEPAG